MVVGHLLQVLLSQLQLVLGDLGGLLHLLERLQRIPADVADGHLAALVVLADLLDQFLAALLRQLGEGQPDGLAVILGIDAQIGLLNGLLNALQGRGVPRGDEQRPGIGGRHRSDLLDGGGGAVVVHLNAVEDGCVGPSGPHGSEVTLHRLHALLHLFLVYLVVFLQHGYASFTIVPIFSPRSTRTILYGSFSANTSTGMWLSMDRLVAVESITAR